MQANLVAVRIHLTENPRTFEVKIKINKEVNTGGLHIYSKWTCSACLNTYWTAYLDSLSI